MPNKTLLVLASCVTALFASLALSGCGDDDDPGSGAPQASDDVLHGRNPCSLVDQAAVAHISQIRTVTAKPTGGPPGGVEQCSYNVDEQGVRLVLTVLPAADGLSSTDLNSDREGVTSHSITVSGVDEASVSRFELEGHPPEVSGCAVIGGVDRTLACVYIADSPAEVSADRLEPMVIELLGRLVESL
jgi:hypothetical protein